MSSPLGLATAFLEHRAALVDGISAELTAALETELHRGLADARRAHPDIELEPHVFVRFVAERTTQAESVEQALAAISRMNVADLYVACGCLSKDNAACRAFIALAAPKIRGILGKFSDMDLSAEEVQSLIFERLFVGSAEVTPKIRHYAGEGELSAWVKVVAIRMLLNLTRSHGRNAGDDEALMQRALADEPADLKYMKQVYHAQFKRAFAKALSTLSPRQRNLLRYQLLE